MKFYFIISVFTIAMIGCNGCGSNKNMPPRDIESAQLDLIKENKKQHEKEMKEIKNFIKQKEWPMTETATGLQYWIQQSGNGAQAKADDVALISFTVSLLDNTVCYTASDQNPKQIVVGHDNVETGLHEALQLMHVGDKAKFILPSHLAFGFTGDSGKIPQNASVVYDIHLIALH